MYTLLYHVLLYFIFVVDINRIILFTLYISLKSCEKDSKGRYNVSYTSTVRVTHRISGAFKEDIGAGDAIDKSLGTAVSNALKGSVTDAMKRAVRHFGDKLGNCKCF